MSLNDTSINSTNNEQQNTNNTDKEQVQISNVESNNTINNTTNNTIAQQDETINNIAESVYNQQVQQKKSIQNNVEKKISNDVNKELLDRLNALETKNLNLETKNNQLQEQINKIQTNNQNNTDTKSIQKMNLLIRKSFDDQVNSALKELQEQYNLTPTLTKNLYKEVLEDFPDIDPLETDPIKVISICRKYADGFVTRNQQHINQNITHNNFANSGVAPISKTASVQAESIRLSEDQLNLVSSRAIKLISKY